MTSLLMRWLSEATGQTHSDIINRLALTIDGMLPPDEPGTGDSQPRRPLTPVAPARTMITESKLVPSAHEVL